MRKTTRTTEAEVVAEFLKAELFHPEYDADRENFEQMVHHPDLSNKTENAIRLALLFRRRDTMWRELPEDRQWWNIELEPEDIERINVFPRAHWRRIANGDFQALRVAEKIRTQLDQGKTSMLLAKIHILRTNLQLEGPTSTVMLIGIDEHSPFTLLEGNHRFIASLLLPREIMLRRLRLICGFSPQMHKCCWYKTDLPNLLHYTKNRIKYMWSRDADVGRLLQMRESPRGDLAGVVSFPNGKTE
jgi:hypothetical protein